MGLEGCVTESVKSECCWVGICIDCWIAFDQTNTNLTVSMDFGSWLGFFILGSLGLYNLYWFAQEKRMYYEAQGADAMPIYGFIRGDEEQGKEAERPMKEMRAMSASTSSAPDAGLDADSGAESDGKADAVAAGSVARKDESDVPANQRVVYPWFRLSIAFYCITTGMFALIRNEWQLGKPLLVSAAGHNLSEWSMVSYAYFATRRGQYYSFVASMLWIWFVVCCVVMIPTFPTWVLAQQVAGITLDWLLPFTWWILARQNWGNRTHRDMFLLAWVAHLVHVYFTIIPLVVENLIVGQSYRVSAVLEFAIFMSAVFTMVCYTIFAPRYQKFVLWRSPLPAKFVAPRFWLYTIIALFLGLLTTTIIPAAIGYCED